MRLYAFFFINRWYIMDGNTIGGGVRDATRNTRNTRSSPSEPCIPPRTPNTRGRPQLYHTDAEREAAKQESRRRYIAKCRLDPDAWRERCHDVYVSQWRRFDDARRMVAVAEIEGRETEAEVVAARVFVDHIREMRRRHRNKYYSDHESFRVWTRERVKFCAQRRALAERVMQANLEDAAE